MVPAQEALWSSHGMHPIAREEKSFGLALKVVLYLYNRRGFDDTLSRAEGACYGINAKCIWR